MLYDRTCRRGKFPNLTQMIIELMQYTSFDKWSVDNNLTKFKPEPKKCKTSFYINEINRKLYIFKWDVFISMTV